MMLRHMAWMMFVLCVSACSSSDEEALQQWMAQQHVQARVRVSALGEPQRFEPATYSVSQVLAPFSKDNLLRGLQRDASRGAASNALIAPELARRKEPLEAYPLDAMAMVGSLRQAGQLVALVRVDQQLFQVRVGSHLGGNYGRVTRVTESQVLLRELVQDTVGEWMERTAALQLQEGLK